MIDLTDTILRGKSIRETLIEAIDIRKGVGVLVLRDNKILVGDRADGKGICGPGGHVQFDESLEDAAIRETKEEFGIDILSFNKVGTLESINGSIPSTIFICRDFKGEPRNLDGEMKNIRWVTKEYLKDKNLFEAFRRSLEYLNS